MSKCEAANGIEIDPLTFVLFMAIQILNSYKVFFLPECNFALNFKVKLEIQIKL